MRAAAGDLVTPSLKLVKRIGAGGMGTVWIADHLGLKKQVAVKLMAEGAVTSETFRARFAQEAAAAANVKSAHVVQTFDTGISEELGPFIVMELLEGEDLGARLEKTGPLPPSEVALIVKQAAHALDRAHTSGIVHRDVKPSNLFLEKDGEPFHVKVLDFGIAKLAREAAPPTATGTTIGTLTFMSPEQAAGASDIDGRSDFYSLGLVAFAALTGASAFARESVEVLGLGVYNLPLPRMSERRAGLPSSLDAWFSKACARDRADRFENGASMATALSRAIDEAAAANTLPSADDAPKSGGATKVREVLPPRTEPAPPTDAGLAQPTGTRAPPAPKPRNRWLFAAVGAVAIAGAGVFTYHRFRNDTRPDTPVTTNAEPVKIGVLLDLTGERDRDGQALLAATRAAEAKLNKSGGIRGRPVTFVVKDDQGDVDQFLIDAAESLVKDEHVKVVIGPMTSPQVVVVAPVFQKAGVLQITGTASTPALTSLQKPTERTLFRTMPSQTYQVKSLAKVMREAKCDVASIVASDDATGRPFAEAFSVAFDALGGVIQATRYVPSEAQKSYKKDLDEIAKSTCEVLAVSPKTAARLLREQSERKMKPVPFGMSNLASDDFLDFARSDPRDPKSSTVAEGVRGVRPAARLPWRPEWHELAHILGELDGGAQYANAQFMAYQFDAAILGALALDGAGPDADIIALRKSLLAIAKGGHVFGIGELPQLLAAMHRGQQVDYSGASGEIDFTSDGDVEADLVTWSVKNGVIVEDQRVTP